MRVTMPQNNARPVYVKEETSSRASGITRADCVKIVFALSGWALVRSRHETLSLSSGTIVAIPAGLECWGIPYGLVRTGTFYVHSDYLAAHLPWLQQIHPLTRLLRRAVEQESHFQTLQLPSQAMQPLVPRLVRLTQMQRDDEGDFAMLSLISDVFDVVGKIAGAHRVDGINANMTRPRREVVEAAYLLRNQLERAWRVDDLAREVALSSSQLGRLFRRQLGISPAAHLCQLRVDKLAELLTTTDCSVGEAAAIVGWRNPTVAARAFKRRYGITPRQYAASRGRPRTSEETASV